jgi:amino acid transporter
MSKDKRINVVTNDGNVDVYNICKLVFLLVLSALSLVAALAVNETVQKILEKYVKKDNITGYLIYSIIAILLVLIVAYTGCRLVPDIADHIDLSPM